MTDAPPPYGPAATAPAVPPAPAESGWTPPPAAAAPRRGLGITALVFGLIPIVAVVLSVVAVVVLAEADGGGWALLGYGIFFALIDIALTLVCGIVALICGIIAMRRGRGRGLGLAGTILGSLGLGIVLLWVLGWVPTYFTS